MKINQTMMSSDNLGVLIPELSDHIRTIKFLEEDDIHKLLSSITSIRDRAIFSLAYYHGLRVSEVGLLRERDYDPNTPQMFIRRLKNGRSRWQLLLDNEKDVIAKWFKLRGKHGDDTPFFVSRRGSRIARRTLHYLINVYGEKAKIPIDKRHFHVLRHSCATHMVRADIEIIKIRDWLGHKDINNTLIYTDVSDNAMRDIANDWGKFVKDKSKPLYSVLSATARKHTSKDGDVDGNGNGLHDNRITGIVWGKDRKGKGKGKK